MSSICIVGTGYVGLSVGACFADLGHTVTCLDIDESKVKSLREGHLPIYESGLTSLVQRNVNAGRLTFSNDYGTSVPNRDFVFIAVDTPTGAAGEAHLGAVESAAVSLAASLTAGTIIVTKSTVPIGTGDLITRLVHEHRSDTDKFPVVSNPEFQREGTAIQDFLHPDRIVIGSTDTTAASHLAELYHSFNCPVIVTDLRTAEMIKYASNAFLATRISFINEIAAICEALGADIEVVSNGMGLDKRVGPGYLDAGIGWGGSCFPKDVRALEHMGAVHGAHPQLLRAVMEINRDARRAAVRKLREALGDLRKRSIAIFGLSFKPNTDDVRDAPAIEIAHLLTGEGAVVRAYDPVAIAKAKADLGDNVEFFSSPLEAATGADAVVLATEWNEFRDLNWSAVLKAMHGDVLVDGRNLHEPGRMVDLGYRYFSMGRPDANKHLKSKSTVDSE
jgi:UDPglucose 6-dehydrogenase